MISSVLFTLIILAAAALLITAAFSPVETLSWWAGWTEEELDNAPSAISDPHEPDQGNLYIVYLSGISSISGEHLIPREKRFIKGLKTRLPDATIITDVFSLCSVRRSFDLVAAHLGADVALAPKH